MQKNLRSHHYVEKKLHYLNALLSIISEKEGPMNRKNQWFFHIREFNKEYIIQPYNVTISNIPEEEQFLTCMEPAGSINDQDESMYYVNSSFQVHFFNIYLRQLILNIDCDKIIEELDNSEDEFSDNFQKILLLRVV